MKAVRYYTVHEDHIAVHDEPFEASSRSVSMEFGCKMKDIRRMYSRFDLRKAWG